jgi:hypothetical protein
MIDVRIERRVARGVEASIKALVKVGFGFLTVHCVLAVFQHREGQ